MKGPFAQHPVLKHALGAEKQPFLSSGPRVWTYGQFLDQVQKTAAGLRKIKPKTLGIQQHDIFNFLVILFAAECAGKKTVILSPQLGKDDIAQLAKKIGFKILPHPNPLPKGEGDRSKKKNPSPPGRGQGEGVCRRGEIILTTSGSTGLPKGVVRTWESLTAAVSAAPKKGRSIWLLTYDFASFAGLQVILHALMNQDQIVAAGRDPVKAIKRAKITHISGTPSFWRGLLAQISSKDLPALKHITLGGEAIPAELLIRIKKKFPRAAITQIYASTEMGACFYVRDGKPGLPASVLKGRANAVQAKIAGGELYIKSRRAMKGYAGAGRAAGWFATGDMVRMENNRIFFAGRKSNIINVGGFKVYPYEVEEVLYQVPGILQARVSGEPSGLLGNLVRADIEITPEAREEDVQRRAVALCQERLARPKVPRVIAFSRKPLVHGSKISRRS